MYENGVQIPSDYEMKLKKLSGYANEEIENYKDQNKYQISGNNNEKYKQE